MTSLPISGLSGGRKAENEVPICAKLNVTVSAFAGAEKITNPATQPDRKRFIGPNRFIVSLVDAIWSVRQVSIWFLDIREFNFSPQVHKGCRGGRAGRKQPSKQIWKLRNKEFMRTSWFPDSSAIVPTFVIYRGLKFAAALNSQNWHITVIVL